MTEKMIDVAENEIVESVETAATATEDVVTEDLFESTDIEMTEPAETPTEIPAEPAPAEAPAKKPRASRKKKATEEAAPETPAMKANRRRRATRTIKSLTGSLEATTEESAATAAWQEVMHSLRFRKFLTGTVSGIEIWNKMPCAVVFFRGIKVLIPATQFLLELPTGEDLNERSATYLRKTYSYMENRLGSEIEFVIVGFADKADQIVAGSRSEVMKSRQREYFTRKRRGSDEYLLNEGSRVEVRVASAMRFGLVVEIGGMDVFVPNNEVSWARTSDVSAKYQAGQKVIAVVTKLDRSNIDDIKVEVSIKQATTDPFDKALKKLNTDVTSKYLGEVMMVDKTGVYVQLEDDIQVVCRPPRSGSIAVGSRVAVRIYDINETYRTIRGNIVWNGGISVH